MLPRRWTGLDRCQSHPGPRRAREGLGAGCSRLLSRVNEGHAGSSRVTEGRIQRLLRFPLPPPIFLNDIGMLRMVRAAYPRGAAVPTAPWSTLGARAVRRLPDLEPIVEEMHARRVP